MKRRNSTVLMMGVLISALLLTQGILFAQKSCVLISETSDPDPRDATILEFLSQNYLVDVYLGDDVNGYVYNPEDFTDFYDFGFVSESISSRDTDILHGALIPLFYTELWASQWDIMGLVPQNINPLFYGNTTENNVTVTTGDHDLSAGFAAGYATDIVSGTDDGTGNHLTYSVPQVDHISIAALTSDPTQEVVFGVEAGTAIYDTSAGVTDLFKLTENRIATCGINANANNYITEDAWKFMQAGIDWILSEPSPVQGSSSNRMKSFNLAQNYPNPFNPVTTIEFSLENASHATLTVYNAIGQVASVLVDQEMSSGQHRVNFDGKDLNSGIYFYELKSGNHNQMEKMILLK